MVVRSPIIRLTVFLLIVLMPAALVAGPVAQRSDNGSSVDWQVSAMSYDRVLLTISTPGGDVISREFKSGEPVTFNVKELASIEDGAYNYQLSVVPRIPERVSKQLKVARAAGDDAATRAIMRGAGIGEPLIESGTFQIGGGTILSGNLTERTGPGNIAPNAATPRPITPVPLDQVIPDDLIVQGSACVGLDCVNNENFGFDTIRMKENNTRVHFDDTSTQAGFPANDWRLIANGSNSGDASKFSIEDSTGVKTPFTLTAGAATNSIFVDSSGRVGFRTSTPVLDLHVSTSNTPALRLEQTNAGGFTAQTWDVAGNEANFFVRDVTGGSRLSFRIRPGAPTSSIDIAADGDVGIGTGSPEADLHVFASSTADGFIGLGEDPDGSSGTQSAFNFGYGGATFGRGVGFINVRPDSNATAPNPSFRIFTVNIERVIVTNAGSVGIGTSAPSSRLHVNGGDIRVSGGSFIDDGVALNVPDYVFEPSYTLMPLPELEEFVKTNRHLPGIPNAAEVKQRGLNLSQMQLKLLEKVEELTLYMLEQKKEVDALRAANTDLKAQLTEIAKSN